MIRVAGPVALVLLAALGLISFTHHAEAMRSTPTSPLQGNATPAATPIPAGPFELPGAVPISLVIQNAGEDDRLVRGSTPVAERVALHQTRLADGRRVMAIEPDGILILAGETRILEPAASHLMLVGLTTALVQGETFPLTLQFENAGTVTVTVRVRRKVDAAGVEPIPPVVAGDLRISLASAPPAPVYDPTPTSLPARVEGLFPSRPPWWARGRRG